MLAPALAIDIELVPLASVVTATFAAAVTLLKKPPSPKKNAPVPAVMLPVALTCPAVRKLPLSTLPVTLTAVPV